MNRRIIAFIAILLCLELDSTVFTRINIADIRPDAMLAATVSYAILEGSLPGALFGVSGGLLLDILFGQSLGLFGAFYMAAGLAAGFFYNKFYADNLIVPMAAAATACFLKDLLLALGKLVGGAAFPFAGLIVRYMLPCAILTGLLCALIHLLFKRLLVRQVMRRHPGLRH